jgi:phage repressor protein C with HTH and peptisase S24 domain
MSPLFLEKDSVLVQKQWFFCSLRIKDIIVLHNPRTKKIIIKRIVKKKNETYFVEGDNKEESTDSNEFGWINRELIIGKVIFNKKR